MAEPLGQDPLVAVVIPALNEAGKIGRVLDKIPRDGRFEAIVVDDGSTDGPGVEAPGSESAGPSPFSPRDQPAGEQPSSGTGVTAQGPGLADHS